MHGVEVTHRRWQRLQLHTPWNARLRRYVVITVATSDQPFGGFNASRRGAVLNGDPMALYPDFVEWARNRQVLDTQGVQQDGPGLRSISWQGRMTRRRTLAALNRLTP